MLYEVLKALHIITVIAWMAGLLYLPRLFVYHADAEIARAGADKVSVVLYPLSFVSEHSETLVELDIEYRHLADKVGVPSYIRVPTVGTHPLFIAGLARLVRDAL